MSYYFLIKDIQGISDMEQSSFVETLVKTLPSAVLYHYKPVFEDILENITDYQSNRSDQLLIDSDEYLSDDAYMSQFAEMIYLQLDKSISPDDLAVKLETIQAGNDMLVGCLEKVEEFGDKTGDFATQNKVARRLLQNVMSFLLYSLSQVAEYNSDLEQLLLEKSESALLPFGFGE